MIWSRQQPNVLPGGCFWTGRVFNGSDETNAADYYEDEGARR
ncbi:MAG: hypothetical protein ACRDTJ_01175 [Pseudonocardiaceae bacterium]